MLAVASRSADASSAAKHRDTSRIDAGGVAEAVVPPETNGSTAMAAERSSSAPSSNGNPTVADFPTLTEIHGEPLNGAVSGEAKRAKKGVNSLWDSRLPLPRADAVSFGTVIDGCSRARNADAAVRLLTRMRQSGIGGGRAAAGGPVSRGRRNGAEGGGDCGEGGVAVPPPNSHCVTAAITACGRAKRPQQAVALLREAVAAEEAWRGRARDDGVDGRTEVRVAAAAAAADERKWRDRRIGREVAVVLEPAYNAAIDACVRARRHDEARALVVVMREKGVPPGRMAFNGLLLACSDSAEVRREGYSILCCISACHGIVVFLRLAQQRSLFYIR